MPKMTTWIRIVSLAAVFSTLVACGKGNESAPLVDSTGKHPAGWISQHGAVALPSTSQCAECHGSLLDGGISKVSCMNPTARCHTSSPAVNPTGCISCHGVDSTGPDGTKAPNRANAHAKHLALTGVSCGTCHAGSGSGTALHANGTVDILFSTTFNAKTGSPSFNADNDACSAVSCHGGKTTPSWATGSIVIATDCLKCHEQGPVLQSPQYNSYYSGQATPIGVTVNLHQLHLALNDPSATPSTSEITCTSCHNITTLASNHFSGLATPVFEGTPANTIGGGTTKISAYSPYVSTVPSGNCTTVCHANRYWNN